MSLDERQERQLLGLVGRVTDTERLKTEQKDLDALEKVLKSWVGMLLPIASTGKTYILDDNYSLSNTDPSLIVFDCGGGGRTVFLPRESRSNKFYILINDS